MLAQCRRRRANIESTPHVCYFFPDIQTQLHVFEIDRQSKYSNYILIELETSLQHSNSRPIQNIRTGEGNAIHVNC